MVYIDIETSNENREPRVVIHCNYDHREEAEELKDKIQKAMKEIESD
jgi:hypothetical protein